jgi:hypothetical protein
MNKIKFLMLVITAVIIFVARYFFYLNNMYWENVRNSENIRIGMSTQEVIEIMGLPEEVLKSYVADSDSLYFYQPPIMASDGIQIFFYKGRVNRVVNYEGT